MKIGVKKIRFSVWMSVCEGVECENTVRVLKQTFDFAISDKIDVSNGFFPRVV